jgi:hypothetical protein
MDWIGFQHKVRPFWQKYFCQRPMTLPKVESAKNKDIGEQAKSIDAIIRAISRGGSFLPPSDEEQDMLAIRFDWGRQVASNNALHSWPLGEEVSEDDFEHILVKMWHRHGREKYKPEMNLRMIGGRRIETVAHTIQPPRTDFPPEQLLPPPGRR